MSAKDETQEDRKPCDEQNKEGKDKNEVEEEEEEEEGEVEDVNAIFGKPPKTAFVPTKGNSAQVQQKKMEQLDQISKQKEKEESEKMMYEQLKPRYTPKTRSASIILKDLVSYKKSETKDLRFTADTINDELFHWEVIVDTRKLKPDTEFYKDAIELKVDAITFRIIFPPDYPDNAPFVYVRTPRFVQHTGHVTYGGSLCLDLLSINWSPSFHIDGLITSILDEMMTEVKPEPKPKKDDKDDTNIPILPNIPRIDRNYIRSNSSLQPYSLEEAINAYVNMAKQHGWPIAPWIYTIDKEKYK